MEKSELLFHCLFKSETKFTILPGFGGRKLFEGGNLAIEGDKRWRQSADGTSFSVYRKEGRKFSIR